MSDRVRVNGHRVRFAAAARDVAPKLVPVAGVGRHTPLHYCETCGRKLSVCRCDRDERETT